MLTRYYSKHRRALSPIFVIDIELSLIQEPPISDLKSMEFDIMSDIGINFSPYPISDMLRGLKLVKGEKGCGIESCSLLYSVHI